MLRTHSLRGHGALPSDAQPVLVVRVALGEPSVDDQDSEGLSRGALVGIIVGSILGAVALIVLIALLSRCLRQRRKISTDQTKAGTTNSDTKASRFSLWACFRKRSFVSSGGRRVPPPVFGSDKQDEISDTSFVLPELGGPNPHNKFDGMEWVDIKGLDDDRLQDISTDLRKYSQGQRR